LLVNRCVKYWIPERHHKRISSFHNAYLAPMLNGRNASSHHVSSINASIHNLADDRDEPEFQKDIPEENSLAEFVAAMNDPRRYKLLETVAKNCFCKENLDFVMQIQGFNAMARSIVRAESKSINSSIREYAISLIKKYVGSQAEEEVNLPAKKCAQITLAMQEWMEQSDLVSDETAGLLLGSIPMKKRMEMFEPAYKEILIMLYQNVWNKFRTLEMQSMAAGEQKGDDHIYPIHEV